MNFPGGDMQKNNFSKKNNNKNIHIMQKQAKYKNPKRKKNGKQKNSNKNRCKTSLTHIRFAKMNQQVHEDVRE